MGQAEDNISDAEFIFAKIKWFATQPQEVLSAHFKEHKTEWLYCVPHPSGRGAPLICGYEASERFYAMAKRFLSSCEDKAAKVQLSEYVNELRGDFVWKFLKESKPIDRRNVDRLLSSAYRRVARSFDTRIHYIPCTVFRDIKPAEFDVGPVRFMRRSRFDELHAADLDAHKGKMLNELLNDAKRVPTGAKSPEKVTSPEQCKQYADFLVDSVRDFFGHYDWIAVVEVAECDDKTSAERALLAVRTALNVLKLLIGEPHTDRLGTAYGAEPNARTATLTRSSSGELHISVSVGYRGNAVGENWLSIIHQQGGFFFDKAAEAIYALVDPKRLTYLKQRFLDAMSWYGDAASEVSNAARVVKYVSAVERITGTGKEHDAHGNERPVTEIVTRRSTILYHHHSEKSYEECKREVSAIYECRSNLVHGSVSPFDGSVAEMANSAADVARLILLGALDLFTHLGFDDANFSVKDLKRSYLEFETRFAPPAP